MAREEEEEDVKLLSLGVSAYAMRAILALEVKGVKYEIVEQVRGEKSQLLLEANPVYKKFPVLLHNGKAIPESLIIVAYVDEAWPGPAFFPPDPFGRAMAYFWADFPEKNLMELGRRCLTSKGEEKEALVRELCDNILTLERRGFEELQANPFLNGSSMGYADISLAPVAAWFPVMVELGGIRLPNEEEAPRFHAYSRAIREHPAAKVAFPEQQKLLAFARAIFQ